MILTNLNIHCFGKFREMSLKFRDGCNIILGKNEAGKSTVFHLIDHLLFTTVNLTKRELDRTLKRWFPAAGGDTLHAQLSGELESGKNVELMKRWGAAPEMRLRYGDGAAFSEKDTVKSEIETLWGYSSETVRQVCLLPQSALSASIPSFRDSRELHHSLSDILQESFIESGGISISGFIETVRERYGSYFSRWDMQKRGPEQNRGLEHPWKKDVGTVLEAWYGMKEAELEFRKTEQLEQTLAELQRENENAARNLTEVSTFLSDHEAVFHAAGERKRIESELREVRTAEDRIRKDRQAWEKCRNDLGQAEMEKQTAAQKVDELNIRLASKDDQKRKRKRLEQYRKLEDIKAELEKSQEDLKKLQTVPDRDFHRIKDAHSAVREGEITLRSGTVHAVLRAKNNISFSFIPGLEKEKHRDLLAGNSVNLEGEGKLRLSHDDWELDIYAGNNDYETIKADLDRNRRTYDELCGTYGIKSVEEAEEQRRQYAEAKREFELLQSRFDEERGGESFDELAAETAGYGPLPPETDDTALGKEFGEWKQRLETAETRIERLKREIVEFGNKYQDEEALLDLHADTRNRQKQLTEELENIPKLPEPFTSSEEFIERYRERLDERETLRKSTAELTTRIELALAGLPDVSSEDLAKKAKHAAYRFKTVLAEGETLGRILRTAEDIQQKIKKHPYADFIEKAEKYLVRLTGQQIRYTSGSSPFSGRVISNRGETLDYEQLSGGTKDTVSLAVRLSMADYYLGERKGFLLFDDPLVEMDPVRQRRAAELILETAERYQCILFTCHPHMRELFPEANIMELV